MDDGECKDCRGTGIGATSDYTCAFCSGTGMAPVVYEDEEDDDYDF